METNSNSQKIQLPPNYISLDDLPQMAMRVNVQIMALSIMQRIENFARGEFDKLRKRGITLEYIMHSDPINDGVQTDIFVKVFQSNIEPDLVDLVVEEELKRIENFARATMNVVRYRGIIAEHYLFHKYEANAIHVVIGAVPLGIRLDLFKRLDGKQITLNADKYLNEQMSNEQMGIDKKRVKEDYRFNIKEINEKIKQIIDTRVPKNAEEEIDDFVEDNFEEEE